MEDERVILVPAVGIASAASGGRRIKEATLEISTPLDYVSILSHSGVPVEVKNAKLNMPLNPEIPLKWRVEAASKAVLHDLIPLQMRQEILQMLGKISPEAQTTVLGQLEIAALDGAYPTEMRHRCLRLVESQSPKLQEQARLKILLRIYDETKDYDCRRRAVDLLFACYGHTAGEMLLAGRPHVLSAEETSFWKTMGMGLPKGQLINSLTEPHPGILIELLANIALDLRYGVNPCRRALGLLETMSETTPFASVARNAVIRELEDTVDERGIMIQDREKALLVLLAAEKNANHRVLKIGQDSEESRTLVCETVAAVCHEKGLMSRETRDGLLNEVLRPLDEDRYREVMKRMTRPKQVGSIQLKRRQVPVNGAGS